MKFIDYLFAIIKEYALKNANLHNFVVIANNYEQDKDAKHLNILQDYMHTIVNYFMNNKQSLPEFDELLKAYKVLIFIYHHIYCNQHLDTIMIVKPIIVNIDENAVIEQLSTAFSQNMLTFPWKRLFMGDPDVRFVNLVNYESQFNEERYKFKNLNFRRRLIPLNFKGRYITFVTDKEDYNNIDVITDFFQEQQRLKARRQDQTKSPLDIWYDQEFQLQFLFKVLNEHGQLNTEILREAFYEEVKEATLFKPTLVVSIIKTFSAKRMLDFSAGWGDRLIRIVGLEEYQAYDPNLNLKKGHQDIIRRYVPIEQQSNFKIDYIPFEQANPSENHYDLVFTSPPFFDFEIYTDLPGQSTSTYTNINAWIVNFLFASIHKATKCLKDQSFMIIHITDVYKTRVVEPMVLLVKSQIRNLNYWGVIASKSETNVDRPMWVFQKDQSSKNDEQSANLALQTYYPGVYFQLNDLSVQSTLNPEFIFSIAQSNLTGSTFQVVRDDYLPAGTKQRALALYLNTMPEYDEFIYVSPPNGYAQVALAYVANILGKHATIFVSKLPRRTSLTQRAIDLGATVIEKPGGMKVLKEFANKYIENKPKSKILPFGLDDQIYIDLLASQIQEKWPTDRIPTTFWLVAGSGTILRALHQIWPNAFYNIVQVGKEIYPDIVAGIKHKLYEASERFQDPAEIKPPYPSVETYDAKLWQFVQQYGSNNDYIWNVAKDI